MDHIIKFGAVNQVEAGDFLAHEGARVNAVFMVLKGHIVMDGRGCVVTLGAGSFAGINDVSSGQYLSSYYAAEDASVFPFEVKDSKAVAAILGTKPDYAGVAIWTLARTILDLSVIYNELVNKATGLADFIKEKYEAYKAQSLAAGFKPANLAFIDQISEFRGYTLDAELAEYYRELVKRPVDKYKTYFADSVIMAVRHVHEEADLITQYQSTCAEITHYVEECFYLLMNEGDDNLYIRTTELVGRLKNLDKDRTAAEKLLNEIKDKTLELTITFEENLHRPLNIDIDRMEEAYTGAVSGNGGTVSEEDDSAPVSIDPEAVSLLRKSLAGGAGVLTDFAGWKNDKASQFEANVEKYVRLTDRMVSDEGIRKLRKEITSVFMDLYQDVFLKAREENKLPLGVSLFLDYGFVDDRLLSDEQLVDLASLKQDRGSEPCPVYTLREWLELIYTMKRNPSRSEFDLDYEEYLREMKKKGEMKDPEIEKALKDPLMRLSYEVHNMFATNDKLINGQITTFVPILNNDSFGGIPSKMRVTGSSINAAVNQIMNVDPSVFHREIIYSDSEAKIEREPIMKQVYPEFIILPINGENISMWQDISGRKRDSAGRFVLPAFFEGRLATSMVKAFGRFRWELCRTIQSVAWNNIQIKSLTSEYCDYIQYYRKNKDLSEERKEKVKAQLAKARNNTREAFVIDYESWINFEANGAVRLNKVAREIIATYCPFSQIIRQNLAGQPIFDDATARYERNRKKKIYDMELHYKNLTNTGVKLAPEMEDTMKFYKEM